MLGILAWAPTKEILRLWRKEQSRYNALAENQGLARVAVRVRQTWIPEAEKADRCGTCHLGMIGEAPLDRYPPFDAHPPVPHAAESFGCTYCHSGQGRATEAGDAHGEEGSWPHPIFAAERTEAGCGSCHSGVTVPLPEDVEAPTRSSPSSAASGVLEATRTLSSYVCRECPGTGWVLAASSCPTTAPLSCRGLRPRVLGAWLQTRSAPHLARGKMVFQQLGCGFAVARRGRGHG
jgi:hypothetical protein